VDECRHGLRVGRRDEGDAREGAGKMRIVIDPALGLP
jgi:hypothetical protein